MSNIFLIPYMLYTVLIILVSFIFRILLLSLFLFVIGIPHVSHISLSHGRLSLPQFRLPGDIYLKIFFWPSIYWIPQQRPNLVLLILNYLEQNQMISFDDGYFRWKRNLQVILSNSVGSFFHILYFCNSILIHQLIHRYVL